MTCLAKLKSRFDSPKAGKSLPIIKLESPAQYAFEIYVSEKPFFRPHKTHCLIVAPEDEPGMRWLSLSQACWCAVHQQCILLMLV